MPETESFAPYFQPAGFLGGGTFTFSSFQVLALRPHLCGDTEAPIGRSWRILPWQLALESAVEVQNTAS
jgi:hypothetical protein